MTRGGWSRCAIPGYPDVVVLHASRSLDVMPFLSEIRQLVSEASAGGLGLQGQAQGGQALREPYGKSLRAVVTITGPVQNSDQRQTSVPAPQGSGELIVTASGLFLEKGRPDGDMLRAHVPDIAERHVMMCGPEGFMVSMEGTLRALGVAPSAIHSEDFYF